MSPVLRKLYVIDPFKDEHKQASLDEMQNVLNNKSVDDFKNLNYDSFKWSINVHFYLQDYELRLNRNHNFKLQ